MADTVIVGYDGRDHAADALALGRLLARTMDGDVLVVCAYPEHPLGGAGAAAEIARSVREDAEATLERAREQVAARGVGTDERIAYRAIPGPSPAEVLHQVAEEHDALAIAVGATHHGAAVRLLTGSTPERVLEGAPCPVAVAPEGYAASRAAGATAAERPLQIAVALDESPESERALAAAAAFARGCDGRLRVVTAVNGGVGLYPPLDPTAYAQIAELARTRARERQAAALAAIGDVPAETAVLDGDPVRVLLEDAEQDDLLFTGSGRKGPFRRVLLGSVSTALLRHAPCPVVIVPRGLGEPEEVQ